MGELLTLLLSMPRRPLLCMCCVLLLPACSLAAQNNTSTTPVPQFVDVAPQVGLTVSHLASKEQHYIVESMSGGVGFFDCDNDGRLDIVLTNGSSVDRYRGGGDLMVTLYRQDTDGKFTNITEQARLTVKGWGMGVAVADFDNDGNLDLFVTGYGHSVLYRGLGNCKFEDVTEKAGLGGITGFATGAGWGDYDRDGHGDLDEVGMLAGVALGNDGQELGSMGVDFADYDHDGKLDLFVTNYTEQVNNLYRNLGGGAFSDMSWPAKLGQPSYRYVKWGTGFADFDNDGWADLFVANGHVYPQVDAIPGSPGYKEPMQMFRNHHDGTFEDISKSSGVFDIPPESRRGAA